MVNLVLLKLFTSNPTKSVSSAALWSSARQTTGKQDEGLKMTRWSFIYRLINPGKQFLYLSIMYMLMLKLRPGLICHREISHRYQSDMVDAISHFYRNLFYWTNRLRKINMNFKHSDLYFRSRICFWDYYLQHPLLWGQPEKVEVVQAGEEKATGRP